MEPLKNDLILRALNQQSNLPRTPVWLMRQAGRMLPEYRAVRSHAGSFLNLLKNPAWVAEVSLQPVDILDVDACIIFSDILVVPEAMGLPYDMVEKRGPLFPKVIAKPDDLQMLHVAQGHEISYTLEGIRLTKAALNQRVPLIGFAGAPFTIFCYMVEGAGSKTFSKAKAMLYQQSELSHQLLQMITTSTINYLRAQVAAGVDLLQVFDSWAAILSPDDYRMFALPYMKQICDALQPTPLILFAKGANEVLGDLAALNCQGLGIDWSIAINTARTITQDRKTLQGNLDPSLLLAPKTMIQAQTKKLVEQMRGCPHIANLGHGVYPETDPSAAKWFIEAVREHSAVLSKV